MRQSFLSPSNPYAGLPGVTVPFIAIRLTWLCCGLVVSEYLLNRTSAESRHKCTHLIRSYMYCLDPCDIHVFQWKVHMESPICIRSASCTR